MVFFKQIFIVVLITLILSCTNKSQHIVIFKSDRTKSQLMIPPLGCYKVKIVANGELKCEGKLKIFQNSNKTNFADHLKLEGSYIGKEIYKSDWYNGSLAIEFSPDSCIIDRFELIVEFFN